MEQRITGSSINYSRILLGGLAASVALIVGQGIVIALLGSRLLAARAAANLPPVDPQILLSILEILLTAFLIVWIYASIRPRYGAGPVTAIRAGLAVWVCAPLLMTIHMIYDGFGFPTSLLLTLAVCMLPVFLLAGIVGGRVYRE